MPESFDTKVSNIQRQHIEQALGYIAEKHKDIPNSAGIYYILDTHKPASRAIKHECAKHGRTEWFGVKETIRMAYLFAIGKTPPFSEDDAVNELGPPRPRVDSEGSARWTTNHAQKVLEKHGFSCEKRGSESSDDEDE